MTASTWTPTPPSSGALRSPSSSRCSPGWCRSPRLACCRWCPGFLGYVTGLADADAGERRQRHRWCSARCCSSSGSPPSSSDRRVPRRPRSTLVEHARPLIRVGGVVVDPHGAGLPRWCRASQRDVTVRAEAGRRARGRAAARCGVRPRVGALHRPDARRRARAGDRRATAGRGAGCRARGGLLPGPWRAVPAGRRGLRAVLGAVSAWLRRHGSAASGARRRDARRSSGVLLVTGVWESWPTRSACGPDPRQRLPDGAVMATTDDRRDAEVAQPGLGAGRAGPAWAWRQLTSMRTALLLLLLLAVAAVPGSVFPQRGIDAGARRRLHREHPDLGPWLDRLGFFDVYASPWFSAIYLLLFVSLVGCVVPRTRAALARPALEPRRGPGAARAAGRPARRSRSTAPADVVLAGSARSAAAAGASASHVPRRPDGQRRARVPARDRQPGLPPGALSWSSSGSRSATSSAGGDVIVLEGETVRQHRCSATTRSARPAGRPRQDLPPFIARPGRLRRDVRGRLTGERQFGAAARLHGARTSRRPQPGRAARSRATPGQPPAGRSDGAEVYLLGNGYAPVVTVRDEDGDGRSSAAPVPFLPQDDNYTSVGASRCRRARPRQLGLQRLLPADRVDRRRKDPARSSRTPRTRPWSLTGCARATCPRRPAAVGLHPGHRRDDPARDRRRRRRCGCCCGPGRRSTLPGGRGSVTFDRVERFAGLSIRHDPGRWLTLGAALLALAGLVSIPGRPPAPGVRAGATGPTAGRVPW